MYIIYNNRPDNLANVQGSAHIHSSLSTWLANWHKVVPLPSLMAPTYNQMGNGHATAVFGGRFRLQVCSCIIKILISCSDFACWKAIQHCYRKKHNPSVNWHSHFKGQHYKNVQLFMRSLLKDKVGKWVKDCFVTYQVQPFSIVSISINGNMYNIHCNNTDIDHNWLI